MAPLKVAPNHPGGRGPVSLPSDTGVYALENPIVTLTTASPHSVFLFFLFFIDSRKRKLSLFISKIWQR
jgi:hypothetical protein